jgi:hypothetical protein
MTSAETSLATQAPHRTESTQHHLTIGLES